jgi:molybdopterin/thiamine biosynthesis adenylyltransferase
MQALNPDVQVHALTERADALLLNALVAQSQVVIDCCDNFETRQAVNAACVQHRVPLVSGAVIRWDGQVTVFDARASDSPCYACVFAPDQPPPEVQCATMGVLAPLVGVIGSVQASEALKLLAGVGSSLMGRLQMLDGRHMAWSELRLLRQPDCPVCGSSHTH